MPFYALEVGIPMYPIVCPKPNSRSTAEQVDFADIVVANNLLYGRL